MSARLFVAVEVAQEDRRRLVEWARAAVGDDPGLRVVPAQDVHLTLAFLGHRPLEEIEPLGALVSSLEGAAAPVLRSAGALWLSPRKPHVLTVAVEDVDGALGRLHGRLWDALEELGQERDRRRLRPHLTVARVRRGQTAPSRRLPELAGAPLAAQAVVLVRSWLGGGPARYEALTRASLRARS